MAPTATFRAKSAPFEHDVVGYLNRSTHFFDSVEMPSETSDIKQFLEIARRKDAKCEFFNPRLSP
jgi:glutaredoxin-related protein